MEKKETDTNYSRAGNQHKPCQSVLYILPFRTIIEQNQQAAVINEASRGALIMFNQSSDHVITIEIETIREIDIRIAKSIRPDDCYNVIHQDNA